MGSGYFEEQTKVYIVTVWWARKDALATCSGYFYTNMAGVAEANTGMRSRIDSPSQLSSPERKDF